MEETVKFTIYVRRSVKEQIKEMAKENSIPASTSNFAAYLLNLGIAVHNGDEAYVQKEVMVEPQ